MTLIARIAGVTLAASGLALAGAVSAQQTSSDRPAATATFAAGCFWCVEEAFDKVDGVVSTTSGYIGGHAANPTYEQVSSGSTGHTEAVQITYDPAKVSFEQLLAVFWRNVDAVDGGGQFCDRGSQYRPAIFYHSAEQQRAAEASKKEVQQRLAKTIATTVDEAGPFYAAEDYHQDYYEKNPLRYKFYKWSCGREQRLDQLWGTSDSH